MKKEKCSEEITVEHQKNVDENDLKEKSTKAVKSVAWYTVGNILLKGIAFISTPIFARLLTKEEYGAFNNISTWHSLIAVFATMELSSAMLRARNDFKNEIYSFMFSQLWLGNLITGILYVLACVFMKPIVAFTSVEPIYIHMGFLTLLFTPATTFLVSHLRFQYKYKQFAIVSIGSAMVTTLFSVVLVVCLNNKLFGRTFGYFFIHAAVGLACYIFIASKSHLVRFDYWKYALKISFPMTIHLLSMYVLNSSDKLMITRICGKEETALYSLAYSCGVVLSFVWSSLNTAFSPLIGDSLNSKDFSITKKITAPYLAVYVIPAILLMLVSPELVYLMGGKEYLAARYVIPPVVAGSIMQYLYTLYVNIEQYEKKTWSVAAGTILASVINLVLNALFISVFGYVAAAYTTLACFTLLFVFHFIAVKKMNLTKCYNTGVVFFVAVLAVLISFAVSLLFAVPLLRYAIVLIYMIGVGVMMLRYKNTLIALLRGKAVL
jgi:O-antigen/teichoic acid export membrane protein